MRITAAIILFLAACLLFGDSTDETPIRVVLSAGFMGAFVFVVCGPRRRVLALLLCAFVLPVHATRVPWLWIAAAAAVIAAFLVYVVRRDRASLAGYPAIGDGAPFVEIEPKEYRQPAARGVAIAMIMIPAIGAVVGLITQSPVVLIVSVTVFLVFGFIWMLAWRPRYRVDEVGIHGRMFLCESTVRWRDACRLDTVSMQLGYAAPMRYQICRVHSATHSVRFYDTLNGSDELKATIAAATGLAWPSSEERTHTP